MSGDTEKLRKKMMSGLNSAGLRVPGDEHVCAFA